MLATSHCENITVEKLVAHRTFFFQGKIFFHRVAGGQSKGLFHRVGLFGKAQI